MDNNFFGDTGKYIKQFKESVDTQMKGIQSHPIGMTPLSQKKIGTMITKLKALSPEERNIRMQEIANIMGHKGNGPDGCDLCKFLAANIK